jgi:Mg2+ and Co2+ transporter CorA
MLRSEFRFSIEHGPRRLLAWALGESFMGFLAIVSAGLTLFPMLFPLTPVADAGIDTLQWGIIGWFAFEYLFAFASSPAKAAFLRSPWRLLDVVTIVLPLATLLPSVTSAFRSSPVLRLARLVRLITLGVRVSGVAVRHRGLPARDVPRVGPIQVTLVADAPEFSPTPATWDELLAWLRSPGREWFHVSNPGHDELVAISAAAGLPAGFLENHLLGTSYPHIAHARKFTAVFLWLPETNSAGQIERYGVLFLISPESLVSLARRPTHAVERLSAPEAGEEAEKTPFGLRMFGYVLERVIAQNERLIGAFEHELRALEEVPIRESSPAFFERTFRAKKELSAAQADLWRLKGVLADLGNGRVALPSGAEGVTELFRHLSNDAEYLYETVINIRDEVVSVLELHLNVVSFDMNRVMRVLGLIPAVIGGLFGMNLADNPWPFTLPQVAFAVSFGMVLCLYFFFVKGWLR